MQVLVYTALPLTESCLKGGKSSRSFHTQITLANRATFLVACPVVCKATILVRYLARSAEFQAYTRVEQLEECFSFQPESASVAMGRAEP